MSRVFLVFFLASFLIAMAASAPNDEARPGLFRGEKPGRCDPHAIGTMACLSTCSNDFDCPGTSKCCDFGCAFHCARAIFD